MFALSHTAPRTQSLARTDATSPTTCHKSCPNPPPHQGSHPPTPTPLWGPAEDHAPSAFLKQLWFAEQGDTFLKGQRWTVWNHFPICVAFSCLCVSLSFLLLKKQARSLLYPIVCGCLAAGFFPPCLIKMDGAAALLIIGKVVLCSPFLS